MAEKKFGLGGLLVTAAAAAIAGGALAYLKQAEIKKVADEVADRLKKAEEEEEPYASDFEDYESPEVVFNDNAEESTQESAAQEPAECEPSDFAEENGDGE